MMMTNLLAVLLILGMVFASGPSQAEENSPAGQVGLVIATADGELETVCVPIGESEVSGYEVLLASGLALEVDTGSGSQAICRISDTGCPGTDCFCACTSGDCVYWSYWHLIDGEWRFSPAGAGVYTVRHGDVEGWVWGPGSVVDAVPPPVMSFDMICGADSGTELPQSQEIASGTTVAVESAVSTVAATAAPTIAAAAAIDELPLADEAAPEPSVMATYLPLLAVLGSIGVVWLAASARRKSQQERNRQDSE